MDQHSVCCHFFPASRVQRTLERLPRNKNWGVLLDIFWVVFGNLVVVIKVGAKKFVEQFGLTITVSAGGETGCGMGKIPVATLVLKNLV